MAAWRTVGCWIGGQSSTVADSTSGWPGGRELLILTPLLHIVINRAIRRVLPHIIVPRLVGLVLPVQASGMSHPMRGGGQALPGNDRGPPCAAGAGGRHPSRAPIWASIAVLSDLFSH